MQRIHRSRNNYIRKYLLLCILLACSAGVYAQSKIQVKGEILDQNNKLVAFATVAVAEVENTSLSILSGQVVDENNSPLEYATVFLKGTQIACSTDKYGKFELRAREGSYTLCVTFIGFQPYEKAITLNGGHKSVNVVLRTDNKQLQEVTAKGQSLVTQVNRTSYNVEAMDATMLHNTTLDVAQALDKISGINIRTTGGLGSDSDISLNGFSGKHVKIFMDGVPMHGAGASMDLAKLPINMVERIEVYKGVVPVEFGSDALGGVINIITKQSKQTFLDASYSYGSFNTHKSNLSFGHTFKNGLLLQVDAYQNYSDNNYDVLTKNLDLETNVYSEEENWYERFHDTYHNEALVGRLGVRNTKWATRFFVEATYSQEKKDIQNANLQQVVFGGKETKSNSIIPALNYLKNDFFLKDLNVSVTAKLNQVETQNIDTMARRYNWDGDWAEKKTEGESEYTIGKFSNQSAYTVANLKYKVSSKHFFSVNNTFSNFTRRSQDDSNSNTTAESQNIKRVNRKNISGLSYRYQPSARLNITLFGKYYSVFVGGPQDITGGSNDPVYEYQTRDFGATGYGGAMSYEFIKDVFQVKTSYEISYRLPSERELFGDEVLETGDQSLRPEKSDNINLNLVYNQQFGEHIVHAEAGLIYRNTHDYIRRVVSEARYGGIASYTNHGKVRTQGIDFEAGYDFRQTFHLNGNFTFLEILNMEQYDVYGRESIRYKDQMPNEPYLFGGLDASYNFFDLLKKEDRLTLGYSLSFIHDFYRSWKSEGGKIIIPGNNTHDFTLNYSMKRGTYNIGFEARNVFDALVYDNFSLQKPGRNFSVKFRYYLHK
ncbi:MAG: energy transducer TonB [Bacteroidales bacterium]|nr:MAG: energy transducer TonB [Bacteroidales bacterium]